MFFVLFHQIIQSSQMLACMEAPLKIYAISSLGIMYTTSHILGTERTNCLR